MSQNTNFTMPFLVRAAVWWSRHGVRGRGAVARAVGRMKGPDDTLFIRTKHGAALSVDYKNFDIYAAILNGGGQWEPHVMDTCQRVLRDGDVFYDIGSNTGLFSLDFTRAVPNLKVVAFEPQPSLAAHIRRSIAENGFENIQLIEAMLGAKEGEATLFLTSHSIHASVIPREKHFRELRLPVHTLDLLVSSGRIAAPDVIKIDIEGGEQAAFEGAKGVLKAHAPTVVFEADENMVRMGFDAQVLFNKLSDAADYQFYRISPAGELLSTTPPHAHGNFLALSPRHKGRVQGQPSR